jgi:hypothetical protein
VSLMRQQARQKEVRRVQQEAEEDRKKESNRRQKHKSSWLRMILTWMMKQKRIMLKRSLLFKKLIKPMSSD